MLSEELKIWGYHASISEKGKEQHLEMADEAAKLERVARAAEEAWPFMFNDIPKALNSKRMRYEKLYDALADLGALGG